MSDLEPRTPTRSVIGGRHGSPTVTIALPFSNINSIDTDLRAAVTNLAALVQRLAQCAQGDAEALDEVRDAAQQLVVRLAAADA